MHVLPSFIIDGLFFIHIGYFLRLSLYCIGEYFIP